MASSSPKYPVRMYAAVMAYFSVAFMGLSGLPAFIMDVVERDNPGASPDEVRATFTRSPRSFALG